MAVAAALLFVGLYVAAAARLRRRGDRWSGWAQASFLAGGAAVILVAVVPLPGGMFTEHMAVHLVTGMAAPLLLVLGRPVTLALRALPPGPPRNSLVALAHSRAVGVLVFPPVAAVVDVGGLWLLYRTPVFASMHHDVVLSVAVHLHVFAAGVLFSFAICQVDPVRRRYGIGLHAVTLLLAGAAHAILAKSLYGTEPPDTSFTLDDLHAGAQLMYYGGDLVEVALAVVLAVQWYTAIERRRRVAARSSQRRSPEGSAPLSPNR
ncbi:MAG: cytochrome c oxidase assembly protein [Rhodococcus sp. (in: high G+C Gram-positive bacteria)]